MTGERTLQAVREDIDAIDEQIQALIIRRTRLVEDVRVIKRDWPIKIQPSREAEVLRRVVGRHRGPFPKRELAAIWRLIIVATLSFEGPFAVAVYVPSGDGCWWDLARDHFGPFTPMLREASVDAVLARVASGDASVGVVPTPCADGISPWWLRLAGGVAGTSPRTPTPRIIARLPFLAGSNAWTGGRGGLVVCPVALVATGRDRSYLIASTATPSPLSRLRERLAAAGIGVVAMTPWHAGADGGSLSLIEVDGFVADDDPRLQCAGGVRADGEHDGGIGLAVVGGYAQPLTADELAPDGAVAPAPAAAEAAALDRQVMR
jgi:chorismate mutase